MKAKRGTPTKSFALSVAFLGALLSSVSSFAMPPFFLGSNAGNERDVDWHRLESQKFTVYHDKQALPLAKHVLHSVEYAYPYLKKLLGVQIGNDNESIEEKTIHSRFDRMPLIVSTRADWGGFANPVTQNIELQSSSGAHAAHYQHELVHRMMYEHFDPNFGPGGRAATLLVLPIWWIEGLAEYLTESIGRIETRAIARTLAERNMLLSYDRLHALYQSGSYMTRGYVTSNRFLEFIFQKAQEKNLGKLNQQFFYDILTPPFFNAPDRFLEEKTGKNGRDLYEEFKQREREFWKARLQGMPKLENIREPVSLFNSSGTPITVFTEQGSYSSSLSKAPLESALLHANPNQELFRLPTKLEGSALFDVLPYKTTDGSFWTAKQITFPNRAQSFEIHHVKFSGALKDLSKSTEFKVTKIPLANPYFPVDVYAVYALDDSKAAVLGVVRGEFLLFHVDAERSSANIVHRWPVNVRPQLVRSFHRKQSVAEGCLKFVVNYDEEKTSLEKICLNSPEDNKVLIPQESLFIQDAVEQKDGRFVLVGAWHELQGMFTYDITKGLEPVAPFPDWVARILPWSDDNFVAAWIYDGEDFRLRKISLEHFDSTMKLWRNTLPEDSHWKRFPGFQKYTPPYERIAGEFESAQKNASNAVLTAKQEEASYRGKHLFTYPSVLFPPISPWMGGVVSFPLQDEMERYRFYLIGNYNFESQALSGTLSYVNNRVWDAFVSSIFTRELFNGVYYRGCPHNSSLTCTGYNYLRESGVELDVSRGFPPRHISLSLNSSLRRLAPLYDTYFSTPHSTLGAQSGTLLRLGAGLNFQLFQVGFYTAPDTELDGDHLFWTTSAWTKFADNVSLGKVTNGPGQEVPSLHFQKYELGLQTAFGLDEHALTFRSSVSTTQGKNALYLREIYQPYRTYLPGAGGGLNAINLSIYGDGNLFRIAGGHWSYRNSVDYSFPLWNDIDQKFYAMYFESIRGELVVARGGVATTKDFKNRFTVTSVSAAARIDIDIKGVKIFPSLAVGKIVDEPGWSLFSEISFTELL